MRGQPLICLSVLLTVLLLLPPSLCHSHRGGTGGGRSRRQRHRYFRSWDERSQRAVSSRHRPLPKALALTSDDMLGGFVKPDKCQPRDEYAASNKGRTCQRKCVSDSDCLNDRKLCLCDGVCGLSCIRPEKECPELPDPPHGQVHLTGRHFNDRAVYTCDDGYQIVGLEQVVCNSDGMWSGNQPSCKQGSSSAHSRYYCGEPTHIPNARHNGSKEQLFYDLDTELTYTCLTGYKRKGFQEAQCFFYNDSARWFGPDLQCHPIDCGAPEDILNGERRGECTTYRCQIKYECVPGFELVGKDTRYCQSDGTWTPSELPACVPVQCPIPDSPVNGKAMFTAVAYKSVVSYGCNHGFMIVGESTRTCGEDKQWSGGEPECKQINCGSPGFLPNGWLEGSKTTLHATVTFRCIDGMTFDGESFRTTCKADGKWSHPVPKCLAPCIVPNIEKGRAANFSTGSTIRHGDSVNITCHENFELAASTNTTGGVVVGGNSVRCNNGTWTTIPRCEPARCKELPEPPENGMVVVPRMRHGGEALYECKDGYVLKGPNTTSCHFGNWTGVTPRCELVYCPFPGYIDKGKVLLVGNMGLYDYRPYVRKVMNNRQIVYECGKGYDLIEGPPGATCIDGRWSPPELPRCQPEFHPKMVKWKKKRRKRSPLVPDEEEERGLEMFPIRVRRFIQQRRRRGDRGGGGGERSRRSYPPRTALCPVISEAHMKVFVVKKSADGKGETMEEEGVAPTPYPKGTVLRLVCAEGHKLNSEKKRVRCRRGEWRPQNRPRCEPVKCRLPPVGEGGVFVSNLDGSILPGEGEINHDASVTLRCDQGYFVSGPKTRKCSLGEWVGGGAEIPRCVGNPCKLTEIPGGGRYLGNGGNYRPGQLVPHGTFIDFECQQQKSTDGGAPVRCERGQLLPANPECLVASSRRQRKTSSSSWPGAYEYSSSPFLVPDGDLNNALSELDGPDFGVTSTRLIQPLLGCPQPQKVSGSLLYLSDASEPMTLFPTSEARPGIMFPHGAEVRFDCLPAEPTGPLPGDEDYDYYYDPDGEEDGEDDDEDTAAGDGAEATETNSTKPLMRSWKLLCLHGRWEGRAQDCDDDGRPRAEQGQRDSDSAAPSPDAASAASASTFNASCPFPPSRGQPLESNMAVFHGDRQLSADAREQFEPGAELVYRCVDIGKFKFKGSRRRRCIGGEWDGKEPKCVGLNQLHGYSVDRAPTILIRHKGGRIAQSNDGHLVVTPGTIIHLECLFVRRFGQPQWIIENYSGRTYPQGWTSDPGRDAQLEYRLSIYHARVNDTGSYTCTTPEMQFHRVRIIVVDVRCPRLVASPGLSIFDVSSRGLNDEVHFGCLNGNSLMGHSPLRCLPSGRWSHPTPACLSAVCPETVATNAPPALRVSVLGLGVGDRVVFDCAAGFVLEGPTGAECRPDGRWSVTKPPHCSPVRCPEPEAPANGYFSVIPGTKRRRMRIEDDEASRGYVGDSAEFHCKPRFMMEGHPIAQCGTDGKWSNGVPRCVPACTFPGSIIGGRVSVVRFYYRVGETVSFKCMSGRRLVGAARLECLSSGVWSGSVPLCVN